jgi:hypothetical protein
MGNLNLERPCQQRSRPTRPLVDGWIDAMGDAAPCKCSAGKQTAQPASIDDAMRPWRVLIGRLPAAVWCFETLLSSGPLGGRFRWGQGCEGALWPSVQWDRMGQKMEEGTSPGSFSSPLGGCNLTCWSEKRVAGDLPLLPWIAALPCLDCRRGRSSIWRPLVSY